MEDGRIIVHVTALETSLASQLKMERQRRHWSIADLAHRSGVSRAMISKIERGEASPTAALLGRLSGAFNLTLSTLLARAERDLSEEAQLMRSDCQLVWTDPETGYRRWSVSPLGADPELVQVELPPGARVAYPAASFDPIKGQCVWVLSGALFIRQEGSAYNLAEGDCLALALPKDCLFLNPDPKTVCRYLVALTKRER